MQQLFGLIGYPLGHSFSKKYFSEKFAALGLAATHTYETFELPEIEALADVLKQPYLKGLNVTIPYKQAVRPFLNQLHETAARIGAVNVIKCLPNGQLIGYNSDYYGFRQALGNQLGEGWEQRTLQALVLGNGGAAKAVKVALEDMQIPYKVVSRNPAEGEWNYKNLVGQLADYQLIVNTTPLGTFPNTDACPDLPYQELTPQHYLFDLVYNPPVTKFLEHGLQAGASTQNGYDMLVLQAEKSWEIWTE